MDRKPGLLYTALFLSVLLASLHWVAIEFYLYWSWWWFDWLMHFLGGLTGGMAAYWVLYTSGLWRRRTDTILLPALSVFVCLMMVGVAWEIFEYAFDIGDSHESKYARDVIHDLIMDGLGAITAVWIGLKFTLLKND